MDEGRAIELAALQTELRTLIGDGKLRCEWAPEVLSIEPASPPPAIDVSDRVRGMLLGLAIGDSLGNTSESMTASHRKAAFGEVRDYLPNKHAGGKRIGTPSDDTQMAFWILEHLIEHGRIEPDTLADTFCKHHIFGIGGTVKAFISARKAGATWWDAGQPGAGNGGLMRLAPVLAPHVRDPSVGLWRDAVLATAVTHNGPAAISASVAFAGILWDLLGMDHPPPEDWWVDCYVRRAMPVEGETDFLEPRFGPHVDKFSGPLWRYVADRADEFSNLPVAGADAISGSGAYLLETVPIALHILRVHAHDPEEAIVRAVNDTKDNDTVAAIVGQVVGALHGAKALPGRWIKRLTGRLGAHDDGRVFDLINSAVDRFLVSA